MSPLLAAILLGGLGGLLISFLTLSNPKQKPQLHISMEPQNSTPPRDHQPKRLTDRWAFKLAMAGIAMGIFTALGRGYPSIGFMIGFALPFALIFGFIGLIIDFFKK
jgi:hypothetical protein